MGIDNNLERIKILPEKFYNWNHCTHTHRIHKRVKIFEEWLMVIISVGGGKRNNDEYTPCSNFDWDGK